MMSAAIDRSTSRSLLSSWKELMERLGPLMPGEGKMIYANPHSRRTEIMRLGNDHLIQPDEWAEKHYLDCGPLLDALRGKQWVLSPRPVEVVGRRAKASIFEVAGGFTITVTFGGKAARARLTVRVPLSLVGERMHRRAWILSKSRNNIFLPTVTELSENTSRENLLRKCEARLHSCHVSPIINLIKTTVRSQTHGCPERLRTSRRSPKRRPG